MITPGRYESKTVLKKKVANRDGLTLSTAQENLDRDKVVKTSVEWDTDVRKPETVTVTYGEADSITAANAATSATGTATITTTDYNTYGLPTGVVVQGSGLKGSGDAFETQYRAVFTRYSDTGSAYSASGYFPYEIKQRVKVTGTADAASTAWTSLNDTYLTTQTRTEPKTGLPTRVEDVSDVVTTTTYDALARPRTVARTGYPTQHLSYHAPDSARPSRSVMYIHTRQAGVPDTKEYKDLLGRTLRTATRHFDGSNVVKQDVEYNARGLVYRESQPFVSFSDRSWTTYSDYDVLGRPGRKVTHTSNDKLTTDYDYQGLTTMIDVTPGVGHTLEMYRTYNSLEQLMKTEDANTGTTQYAYDGSGNPVIIQDAVGQQIVARYDALGRKTYVDDPNMGRTDFRYNDFGELDREIAAGNSAIRYDMDLLGRVTHRYASGEDTAVGLDGFKVGLGAKSTEQTLSLEQTFSALEACQANVLLLLDEVQHLATRPDDESFINFTAALRSFMANRSDKKVKGVFTGSSQDALSRLFAATDAPFYDSAQTLPFKPLSESFVTACINTFEKVTSGKQLSKNDALAVFIQLNSAPGRFISLLKQMALNMVYDINKGSEFFTPEIMDAEVTAFQNTVQKLTEREMAVLVQLIQTECKDPYSESNIDKLKQAFGASASKSTIQNAMTKLSTLDIIYKAGHGEWRFSDPAFVKYIIMAR